MIQVIQTNISLMQHQENTMYCAKATYWGKKYRLCILGEKLGRLGFVFFFSDIQRPQQLKALWHGFTVQL